VRRSHFRRGLLITGFCERAELGVVELLEAWIWLREFAELGT
jgi:hypothetical protein